MASEPGNSDIRPAPMAAGELFRARGLLPAFRRSTYALWAAFSRGPGMAATVGDIGAYCITSEEPDKQAETHCTNGERNPLVYHSHRMAAFAYPTMSSLPECVVVVKRRSDTPSAGRT
jgi:hypothetical protein